MNQAHKKVFIGGIGIDNVEFSQVLQNIENAIVNSVCSEYIVTPNVDHIIKLNSDSVFKKIYDGALLVLADGMPLIWAARFLGTPIHEKISGSDLFPRVCGWAAEKGYRLFFLGGRPCAADKAAEVICRRYPEGKVVGVYCPPFGFENDESENARIVKMIKQADPDILFVGLGAPKQEKWIYEYKDQIGVPLSIGIGVTFEYTAGIIRRAPKWMQHVGLEWFWRLMMEPRRLWKRYLVDDPVFFWLVFKQKIQQIRDRKRAARKV